MSGEHDISLDKLFAPFLLGPSRLANRMVMAPMSRNRADVEDAADALTAKYYEQRATAGLIITEASPVSPAAHTSPRAPGIYSAWQTAGWSQVTQAVHDAGGKIFLQLWHAGRISHPSGQPDGTAPIAPSAIAPQGTVSTGKGTFPFVTPRALAREEIPMIVAQFADAAFNAKQAGFDGVEIHAGNGYLIDQFLRDDSNRRPDAYGGSVENRARFLLNIADTVAAVWGKNRVGVRLSPVSSLNSMRDSDPQRSFNYFAEALSGRGLAFLHVDETSDYTFDWPVFRRCYRGNYIANSGYDRTRAIAAIESGHADLISFGRPFLANPDLVARFRTGGPLNHPDRSTFYGGDHRGYTDYPFITDPRRLGSR